MIDVKEIVHILIPTTPERKDDLAECIKAIEQNTDYPHEIIIDENNDGGWVKPVHRMLENVNGLCIILGTDVRVQKGWLDALVEVYNMRFPERDGICQPFDEIQFGRLATHPFAHSETLKKYISKEYIHCYSDNEMTERAMADRKYIYVPQAKIEHRHFINGKAKRDKTYDTIYGENMKKDRETYMRRKINNFKPENNELK